MAFSTHMLLACHTSSVPYKQSTPPVKIETFEDAKITKDGLNITIDKRVDILFVIDDSKSMAKHQDHLAANIGSFVDGLANKTKDIDFQIGVTVNHDQERYLKDDSKVPRICKKPDGTEVVQWEDAGTLKYLKASDPEIVNQLRNGRRYVTNVPGYLDILKNTLLVGATKFEEKSEIDSKTGAIIKCAEGSEKEDLFTPAIQAVNSNGPLVNKGFRRPGAFLVIIIVTDAKDSSNLNAGQVYEQLKSMTGTTEEGQPKLRVFAVAMNQDDIMKETCKPDPSFGDPVPGKIGVTKMNYGAKVPDHEILKLARLTSDDPDNSEQILSICSDFGPALSNFTDKIVRDVIPDVRIRIPGLSDRNADKKLTVSIGGVPLTEDVDWRLNPETNFLTIYSSKVDWSQYRGQQIHVNFTPVNPLADTTKPVE